MTRLPACTCSRSQSRGSQQWSSIRTHSEFAASTQHCRPSARLHRHSLSRGLCFRSCTTPVAQQGTDSSGTTCCHSTAWQRHLLSAALAAAVSVSALWPLPALADIQDAPSVSATQTAKALPKQAFDKNKVWLILLGGAAGLFGITLAVESQSGLFPAIARSNQMLRMSASEREAARASALEQVSDEQLEAAVMDGITTSYARQDTPGLPSSSENGQSSEHGQADDGNGSQDRPQSRAADQKVTSDVQ